MSNPDIQKNYLFVSNNCQHSKRLMLQLQKSAIMSLFQIINIDDTRIQLPKFVQCVPTLYIPSKRHVLTDTDLFQWFQNEFQNESKFSSGGGNGGNNRGNSNMGNSGGNSNMGNSSSSNNINIADITGDASILPFQMGEMGSGLSGSSYSFIEDDKNDLMNQNYSFLQDRDINKLPDFTKHDAPSNTGGGSGSNNKGSGTQQRKTQGTTDTAYDSLMKSRSFEMQQQRATPQTPNFSSPM